MSFLYPSATELAYYRSLEAERFRLTGQSCTYFSLTRSVNVDPVYDEPFDFILGQGGWEYVEYTLVMTIEFQEEENKALSVRDEGLDKEFDAVAYMSRNEWETNGGLNANRTPKTGDVVFCMGKYFDIVKAGTQGNLIDRTDAVGFKFELKSRSKFNPSRKTT